MIEKDQNVRINVTILDILYYSIIQFVTIDMQCILPKVVKYFIYL